MHSCNTDVGVYTGPADCAPGRSLPGGDVWKLCTSWMEHRRYQCTRTCMSFISTLFYTKSWCLKYNTSCMVQYNAIYPVVLEQRLIAGITLDNRGLDKWGYSVLTILSWIFFFLIINFKIYFLNIKGLNFCSPV